MTPTCNRNSPYASVFSIGIVTSFSCFTVAAILSLAAAKGFLPGAISSLRQIHALGAGILFSNGSTALFIACLSYLSMKLPEKAPIQHTLQDFLPRGIFAHMISASARKDLNSLFFQFEKMAQTSNEFKITHISLLIVPGIKVLTLFLKSRHPNFQIIGKVINGTAHFKRSSFF